MRFPTVALALAGIASTVQGYWMGDIARKGFDFTQLYYNALTST
jgi:hypothetical protein